MRSVRLSALAQREQQLADPVKSIKGHTPSGILKLKDEYGDTKISRKGIWAFIKRTFSQGKKRGRFAHEGKLDPALTNTTNANLSLDEETFGYDPFAEMGLDYQMPEGEADQLDDTTEAKTLKKRSQLHKAFRAQIDDTAAAIHDLDTDEKHANLNLKIGEWTILKNALEGTGDQGPTIGRNASFRAFKPDTDPKCFPNDEKMTDDEIEDANLSEIDNYFQLVVNLSNVNYLDTQNEVTNRRIYGTSSGLATRGKNESDDQYETRKKSFFTEKFMTQVKATPSYKILLGKRKASQKKNFNEATDPALEAFLTDQFMLAKGDSRGECGHTFVRFKRKYRNKLYNQYSFGFWPLERAGSADVVTGRVSNPDPHSDDGDIGDNEVLMNEAITPASAFNAIAYVRSVIGSARTYSFAGYNCTSFGVEVAQAAGLSPRSSMSKAPTDTKRNQRVDSPAALAKNYGVYEKRADEIIADTTISDEAFLADLLSKRKDSYLCDRALHYSEDMLRGRGRVKLQTDAEQDEFCKKVMLLFIRDVEGNPTIMERNTSKTMIRNAVLSFRGLNTLMSVLAPNAPGARKSLFDRRADYIAGLAEEALNELGYTLVLQPVNQPVNSRFKLTHKDITNTLAILATNGEASGLQGFLDAIDMLKNYQFKSTASLYDAKVEIANILFAAHQEDEEGIYNAVESRNLTTMGNAVNSMQTSSGESFFQSFLRRNSEIGGYVERKAV